MAQGSPPPEGAPPDVDERRRDEDADEILRAIRRIVQRVSIHSKQLLRDAGLTVPQMLCLKAIGGAAHNEVTAAEISRELQLRPATLTGIIDRLERDGLVRRERRSHDRRKVCLNLTEEGLRRLANLPMTLQDRFVSRLAKLEPSERSDLLAALSKVVDLIDASSIDASPILTAGDVKTGK